MTRFYRRERFFAHHLCRRRSTAAITRTGLETGAALSFNQTGRWIASPAQYKGPIEAYVIVPIDGGLPQQLIYEGESALVRSWMPNGKALYSMLP